MNRVKRKNNPAFLGFLQYPGIQQGVDVSMDGFYIAAYPAGRLPNGQGSGAGHELEQIQPLPREHLKQKVGRLEADEGSLPFPLSKPDSLITSMPWQGEVFLLFRAFRKS